MQWQSGLIAAPSAFIRYCDGVSSPSPRNRPAEVISKALASGEYSLPASRIPCSNASFLSNPVSII